MGAVVIYAMFAAVDTTGVFATINGTARWTDVASTVGIVAVPVALLMIAGEFDLSSGVMIGTSGLLCGLLTTEYGIPMWPAILLTFAFAAVVGLINGWLVMLTGLPSFIVTLAMFFSLRGINLGVTKYLTDTVRVAGVDDVDGFDSAAKIFASTFWDPYNFRIAVVWWIGITLIATTVLTKTRFGNWIYAVGGDQNAARNTGVPVRRTKITLFVCTSMASALVGIIALTRLHSMQAGQGRGRGVHLHHRRGRRRLPADRRLRLGDRREHRRLDHRHGLHRHRVCRLEHRLVMAVPRRDPLRRGAGQHLHQQARGREEVSDEVTFEEIPEPDLPPPPENVTPALQLKNVSKFFGSVLAIRDISLHVDPGTVTCVLGDNGAGKSTLIKILSGVHQPTEGELLVNGEPTSFSTPRDALGAGIATVFQDLATVPLMSVWRNFFLGNEPRRGVGPLKFLDTGKAKRISREELLAMGIDIRDQEQPVGTLSGGERQAVAIARAVHFGAKVLILDEPTSALGVKQSGVVLKYILQARERGIAVVFITHNPHHAHMVGDRFYLLNRGQMTNEFERKTVTREELVKAMAGGAELEALAHELEGSAVR